MRLRLRLVSERDWQRHYHRALDLGPKNTDAQIGLARLLTEQHQPTQAGVYLWQVLDEDPLNSGGTLPSGNGRQRP